MKLIISDEEAYTQDSSAQVLATHLEEALSNRDDCICYYRFPIYFSDAGFMPSLVLIDRTYGVIAFRTYNFLPEQLSKISEDYWVVHNEKKRNEIRDFEDYIYSLERDIQRPKNNLQDVKIAYFICFPFLEETDVSKDTIRNKEKILYKDFKQKKIFPENTNPLSETQWKTLVSVIQKLEPLNKYLGLYIEEPPTTVADAITLNEQKICVFDDAQQKAAIQVPDSGGRIRGLAGTGKTIILSWKAAYLHFKFPDKKILYTFYTKSLYNQIKKLITSFYHRYSEKEPNWDNLRILHAWGGKEKEGVYSGACQANNIPTRSVKDYWLMPTPPFGEACKDLLRHSKEKLGDKLIEQYDFVLVDEAQDMPKEFFSLIKKLTKAPKRIVIAYDELQNTEDIEMPDFGTLFGTDMLLKKEDDILLQKSYRNNRKVLHTAVALGLGVYSKMGVIQIIEKEDNWNAIGYSLRKGKLEAGSIVEIERPSENSPIEITSIYKKIPPLETKDFATKQDELEYVSKKIIELVTKEKVKPEDILVVSLNSKHIKDDYGYIKIALAKENIASKIPGVIDQSDDFFIRGNITLSSIRRSKGNEAPIVFVLGAEKICSLLDKVQSRIRRSFIFVSITRAKAYCFITSSGPDAKMFMAEYQAIQRDYPYLKFKFPTENEMKEIRQINYITKSEKSKEEYFKRIEYAKKLMESKDAYLPEDIKKKLKNFVRQLK